MSSYAFQNMITKIEKNHKYIEDILKNISFITYKNGIIQILLLFLN